jgi:hypothetical protein
MLLRGYAISVLGACLLGVLLIAGALALGQARQGDLAMVYASDAAGNTQVVLFDPAYHISTPLMRVKFAILTPLAQHDAYAYSADGTLAFEFCIRAPLCDIMLWDGAAFTNITQSPDIFDHSPLWSSDGRLAFQTCIIDCSMLIWDGAALTNITNEDVTTGITSFGSANAAWRDDGTLAFQACVTGRVCDIYVWDGGTVHNLTDSPQQYDLLPFWRTDGSLIFLSCDAAICDVGVWDRSTLQYADAGLPASMLGAS